MSTTPDAFVSCPGLTDDELRQVLRELRAAREEPSRIHRALQIFRYGATDWHQVLWHVARHRLVRVEDNQPLLDTLAECAALDPASSPDLAQIVADLLTRLPDERDLGLPSGRSQHVDDLVFTLLRRDPQPLLARRADYTPRVRCALAFVRGRLGQPLGDDEREQVHAMLLAHAGGPGLTRFDHFWRVDDDGEEQEVMLDSAAAARSVALLFGSGEAWDDGLVTEVRKNHWTRFDDVLPALARLPLAELVQLLLPHRLSAGYVHTLLSDRDDGDDALRTIAETLPKDSDGIWLRHGLAEVLKARNTPPREVCTVVLVAVGPNRMRLVKLLATQGRLGVQAARAAVDNPPAEFPEAMPVAEAQPLAAEVEALGGKLELSRIRTVPGHIVHDPRP
ncbi:ribosomal protein L7/L12 [Nannocystis sp. SCPEA4]|uniref:ribosomal protein L7/L12 n=1 Tax=Nannocystis sp. SCPEA4 TaxID=2996787 RepID=UPI00226D8269|nr:ribosomal protein L7/L12 [Nannocystis sp. SCPEA4]MCY1055707.1 ribosomal protein L7/L12 [Nannocystis sp. SCPEA4]